MLFDNFKGLVYFEVGVINFNKIYPRWKVGYTCRAAGLNVPFYQHLPTVQVCYCHVQQGHAADIPLEYKIFFDRIWVKPDILIVS
jgi:hypothetical protein